MLCAIRCDYIPWIYSTDISYGYMVCAIYHLTLLYAMRYRTAGEYPRAKRVMTFIVDFHVILLPPVMGHNSSWGSTDSTQVLWHGGVGEGFRGVGRWGGCLEGRGVGERDRVNLLRYGGLTSDLTHQGSG